MTDGHGAVRLVIVDDHPVVRDGLRGMFDLVPDVEVVGEASSGPEAVAVVRNLGLTGVHVVLMDLRMPGGDGVEAIRELRAQGTTPRVLVLTTYDTDRDVRGALEAGADGFMLKDARRDDLVRGVRDVAAGRPVLAAEALAVLAHRSDPTPLLTPREVGVLRVVAAGGTNRAAADRLFVSEATVKTHLLRLYAKLGVGDRAAAVRVGYERGIL